MELKQMRRISFEKRIGLNYVSKDEKITNAIDDLYMLFKDNVIMKGGTALNRSFIKENGRFSEDIDLDFINDDFQSTKKYIESKMKDFPGFRLGKSRLMHKTLRFDCYYTNELEHKDKIRVEFYLGHSKMIGEKRLSKIYSPIIEGGTNIFNIYSFEDLVSRKLIALYGRQDGKDMYDLFYSFRKGFDKEKVIESVKELCGYYEIEYESFFTKLLDKFQDFESNYFYIGNTTNHYLTKKNQVGWRFIINQLKKDIGSLIR